MYPSIDYGLKIINKILKLHDTHKKVTVDNQNCSVTFNFPLAT